MQLLDLRRQLRKLDAGAVQQFADRPVHSADLHHVDTMGTGRGYLNKFPTHIGTGPVELVPFQRCDDENRDVFSSHPQRHELHREGLTRAAGA